MDLATRLEIDETLVPLWAQLDQPTQVATALVTILHAGRDTSFQQRYALKWWGSFLPERVTVAALCSSTLADFSAELSRRLQGQIGGYGEVGERQRLLWHELIGLPENEQRLVLDAVTRNAAVCVTLLRADNDAWRRRRKGDTDNGQTANTERGNDISNDLFAAGDGGSEQPAELADSVPVATAGAGTDDGRGL